MTLTRRGALAATAAATLAPHLAQAQGSAAVHRVPVGAMEAFVINDGHALRPDATTGLVVNATQEQAAAAMRAAGETGVAMQNPFNVTVVRTPRGLVVLDAGNGAGANPQVGQLIPNMRSVGLDPMDVVLVAHTHFHGDHVGGLLAADGTPAFPNAAVAVPDREWTFWTDAGEESRATDARRPGFANARRRLAPYAAKMTRFQPGAEVAPGITSIGTPGHSPGHVSFMLSDGGQQLLVIGDAVATPMFFVAHPDWFSINDMDPALTVATRRRLLDQSATDRIPVVGYHFPMPATGRVERAGAGYRLVPA